MSGAQPLINILAEGGLTLIGAIAVAIITSRRVIASQSGTKETIESHVADSKDLLTSLRDEVIARHRVLSHAIERPVFECDPDGLCVFVNREYEELTGLSAGEALGLGWLRCVHPDDQMRVRLAWEWAVQNQERFGPVRYRWVLPDGEVMHVHGESYPTRNGGGRLRGYVGWLERDPNPPERLS